MRSSINCRGLGLVAITFCGIVSSTIGAPPPTLDVTFANGQLDYRLDERGNRVPDYSYAGYRAGESEIPTASVKVTVSAMKGDNTARIQAAIDAVAAMDPDANGCRGAVLLEEGQFAIQGQLRLDHGGVVLRGSGIDATALLAVGNDRRPLIQMGTRSTRAPGTPIDIADEYVPVNARTFTIASTSSLKVGDHVLVRRIGNAEWVKALGMDNFGGDRHGGQWKPGSRDTLSDRTITAIDGNSISVDAPLTDAIDKSFGGGSITPYTWDDRVTNAGVENLAIVSQVESTNSKDEDHAWFGILIDGAADVWVRQVAAKHFVASAVAIFDGARRVTIEDVTAVEPVSEIAGQRRQTFFTAGTQTLFQRCYSREGRHDFAVGFAAAGPNAFVQCVADGAIDDSGPIDSWATGVLYDNVRIDSNELNLVDRKYENQQAGWSAANSFLWQCSASIINVENPSTARNWAYGCWGQFSGDGNYASSRESINPDSLFYAQLGARLKADMSKRAQFMLQATNASSSPTLEQAADMIAASRHPTPSLQNWIARASVRNPISVAADGATNIDDILRERPQVSQLAPPKDEISIRNGVLVHSDGALATGAISGITWWAGGVRPMDIEVAAKKEPALTRFVPGRTGVGLTDDLEQLAKQLKTEGRAGIEQHPPLWYDTRDADHERVRRMNGNVWPPFYEMPYARSGEGVAWDGLSKYDLTKFNPFYWNRLKQFAWIADREGLLLLNNHYFQHNILEAGAHYASFAWRPANNINGTPFPEPPFYAGDKRIFMAEQFYDVSDPKYRALHEGLIRQHLDNFVGVHNVIQLTSDEFTGPLSFAQFWLDTVANWEARKSHDAIVGISATKDVQDALLADATRSKSIDVIDIKYWWIATDGQLYAPEGGKNLAPRQWARVLKPKGPSFESTYKAVREYRLKFPNKPVLYTVDGAERFGWAVLMAGGSLPALPVTTDRAFLSAVATMTPGSDPTLLTLKGANGAVCYAAAKRFQLDLGKGPFNMRWIGLEDGKAGNPKSVAGGVVTIDAPADGAHVVWFEHAKE